MQKTVLSFGEVLWDILPNAVMLGGAPFNFTYRVNCLGAKGLMVSRLGRDRLGDEAIDKVRALGLDTTHIQRDDVRPTGTVKVSFDVANNPDYVIVPEVAYDYIQCSDALLAAAAKADCLCFGTLAQRSPQARQTLGRVVDAAKGAVKLLDINLRKKCYSRDTICSSLDEADILKLNRDEALQLAEMLTLSSGAVDRIAEELVRRYRLACCVVTLGELGAVAVSADGEKVYVPGYEMELVDSLGCGDAFSAGFVHHYMARAPLVECCRCGNDLGAIVATQKGATTPVSLNDLMEFRACRRRRLADPLLEKYIPE